MNVARAFAVARENAGMNQREAAQRLGVNQSTVCFWETGRNFPRASMLVKMADLYCCSMDQLLGRTQNAQDSADQANCLVEKDKPLMASIKNPPAGRKPRRGMASKDTYRENKGIIPRKNLICKGVAGCSR